MQDISNQVISMDKQYRTRHGYPVRVLCVDVKSDNWSVAAVVDRGDVEEVESFTKEGYYFGLHEPSDNDLIEVNPLNELKIDDKVLVRNSEYDEWKKRYFAGINSFSKIQTFPNGTTSWSSGSDTKRITWDFWKKAED